jgi:ribosome-associated protein
VLDVTGLSPVCDYLVLGTGTSGRQMRSVADDALELAEARGAPVLRSHGTSENWIAIDLFDIVVHLFDHESRVFYDLDGLWGDALELELDPNAATDRSESHRSESHRS